MGIACDCFWSEDPLPTPVAVEPLRQIHVAPERTREPEDDRPTNPMGPTWGYVKRRDGAFVRRQA